MPLKSPSSKYDGKSDEEWQTKEVHGEGGWQQQSSHVPEHMGRDERGYAESNVTGWDADEI